LLSEKGDYDGAIKLQQEALVAWKKSLGDYHPNVATVLNNLGELLTKTGGSFRSRATPS